MKGFKLKLELDGNNFISVLKHEKGNEYSLHWRIALGNDKPIVLLNFYEEKKFVVVDWTAHVWVFDIEKKEELYNNKFSKEITGKGALSDDKKQLYLCYSEEEAHVAILSLEDFSIHRDMEYPDIGYVYHFEKYRDKFLLYSCTKWDGWSHEYSIIDIETGAFSQQKLPHPQFDDSDRKRPILDEKNEKLIMPYWGEIEYRKDVNDQPVFMYRMMILDMKTFELEKIISVREFPVDQIDSMERYRLEAVEGMLSNEREEDYQEGLGILMRKVDSVVLAEDGNSFWIFWRGAIVRRVDYDGNLSPLYVAKTNSGEVFKHDFPFSMLDELREDGILFRRDRDNTWLPIENMNQMGATVQDFIAIEMLEVPENYQVIITKSKEDAEDEAEQIYNLIPITSIKNKKSVLGALDYMLRNDWKQVGHYLAFLFKSKKKSISEKEFFKQIWEIDGALDRMEKIAKKALKYGVKNRWGGDNDQATLFNLFLCLCAADPKYNQLGFQFADDMDRDHDNWSCEQILEALSNSMGVAAYKKELENWEDLVSFIEYHEL